METESGTASFIPLGEFLTTEEPVWVWDVTARRILWANRPARIFWGAASLEAIQAKRFSPRTKLVERLTALAAENKGAKEWTETLTFSAASGRRSVRCYIQGLQVAGGRPGLIVKALRDTHDRDQGDVQPGGESTRSPAPNFKGDRQNRDHRAALDAIAARVKAKAGASRDRQRPSSDEAVICPQQDELDREVIALRVRELCHEMRNPLQVILGFAERIRDIAPSGKQQDQLRAYADDVMEGANLAIAILGDFTASMLRPGKEPIKAAPVDLRLAVESCIRLIVPLAKASGIKVYRRIEGGLPALLISEHLLKQILLNLLMNAIRHNKTVRQIKVSARRRKDGTVRVVIEDDGNGMSKKDIKAALRGAVRKAPPPRSGRSGLGLPLVKRLIEEAGGQVAIDSARGKGTSVELLFPPAR